MNTDQEFGRSPEDEQHALVLSGNGTYAAYEIGIMKALIHGMCSSTHHRPIGEEYAGFPIRVAVGL